MRYRVSLHPYDGWFRKWEARVAVDVGCSDDAVGQRGVTYDHDGHVWKVVAKFKRGSKFAATQAADTFAHGRLAEEERQKAWREERAEAYARVRVIASNDDWAHGDRRWTP